MSKIEWSRNITLIMILSIIVTDVFVVYAIYKQNGYLPKVLIVVMTITWIIASSILLIVDHLFRKYYMNQEAKHNKDDEQ